MSRFHTSFFSTTAVSKGAEEVARSNQLPRNNYSASLIHNLIKRINKRMDNGRPNHFLLGLGGRGGGDVAIFFLHHTRITRRVITSSFFTTRL